MTRDHLRWLEMFQPTRGRRQGEAASQTDAVPSSQPSEYFDFFDRIEAIRLARGAEPNKKAHARGLKLLKDNLSPVQRDQFDTCGYFEVVGGQTGRRYRIKSGTQMNIERLDKRGRPIHVLCFLPEGGLVAGDVMLAQKLALELFEADALKVANKFHAGR
jgi:hypothetical protein